MPLIQEEKMPEPGDPFENRNRTGPSGSATVLAFLQARMGSTRLPGKVLMGIHGQTILERAIRRLRAARVIDGVVVLTTCLDEDDAVVEESRKLGVHVHRGPAQDVLGRFHEAAERFQPDVIVRATADNPLIEIGSIERTVDALYWECLDLCMECELPYGTATEAVSAKALSKAHLRASEAHHREHVTLFIKDRPEEFRVSYLIPPECLRHPQLRLTVDTPEDFVFMHYLIGSLPEKQNPVTLEEVLPLALNILNERESKARAVF
jgi:spore coat polysaccharide biosynthesis protein SpsF